MTFLDYISRLTILNKVALEFSVPLLILKSVYIKNDKEDPSYFVMSARKTQSKYCFLIGRNSNAD